MASRFASKRKYLGLFAASAATGAATGAVAGAFAASVYALLIAKGLGGSLAAKATLGLQGCGAAHAAQRGYGVLGLLLPGLVGTIGGGAAGLGVAGSRAKREREPLRQPVVAPAERGCKDAAGPTAAPSGIASSAAAGVSRRSSGNDLQRIRGIGPKFAQLLSWGGIETIAQLAEANPQQVSNLLKTSAAAPTAQTERWIAEARAVLAARASARPSRLATES